MNFRIPKQTIQHAMFPVTPEDRHLIKYIKLKNTFVLEYCNRGKFEYFVNDKYSQYDILILIKKLSAIY